MRKALYLLGSEAYEMIYGPDERRDISALVDVYAPLVTPSSLARDMGVLKDAEVVMSGWGMVRMTEAFLKAAPNLKAVFYGSGSVKSFVTDASWGRGVIVCSAWAANAVPVAEYTLSQILLGLKRCWYYARESKRLRTYARVRGVVGAYGGVVGIVSLGRIAQLVCEHLRRFDVKVIAYDPFMGEEEARRLGIELCGLDEVFERGDVVSLHTPDLPETRGLIKGKHLSSMKQCATFINTARGAVVQEGEMIEALTQRTDLTAILDVTGREPTEADSPLWDMANVVVTPHIAGSQGMECRRMGRYMVEELGRYVKGEQLKWQVTQEMVGRMA